MKQHLIAPPFEAHTMLRNIREFAGIGQEQLSRELEISQGYLSRLENGSLELKFTIPQMIKIKELFGITIDQLLTGAMSLQEVAQKFNNDAVLPFKYRGSSSIIKSVYPFLMAISEKFGEKTLNKLLRKLKLHQWQFADPNYPCSVELLWDILSEAIKLDLFQEKEAMLQLVVEQSLSPRVFGHDFQFQKFKNKEANSDFYLQYFKLVNKLTAGPALNVNITKKKLSFILDVKKQNKALVAQIYGLYYSKLLSGCFLSALNKKLTLSEFNNKNELEYEFNFSIA